jgi:TusA-related sulfurtransferase
MPLVNLQKRMKDLEPGDEIDFIADDSSCVQDVPAWCGVTGNEVVSLEHKDGVITAVLRHGKE